jgi:hypothetical protein
MTTTLPLPLVFVFCFRCTKEGDGNIVYVLVATHERRQW